MKYYYSLLPSGSVLESINISEESNVVSFGGGYSFRIEELKKNYIDSPDLSWQYALNRTKKYVTINHPEWLL